MTRRMLLAVVVFVAVVALTPGAAHAASADVTISQVYGGGGNANTTADLRLADGATDTDNNAADFTAGAPNPRGSGGTPRHLRRPGRSTRSRARRTAPRWPERRS